MGGYMNAYTSREATAYYARVLGQDVGLALDVIADILLNPVFAPEEIDIERGVILQEIGQALDTPDDVIFDWLQERAYPDQPIGRTILGPPDRVRAFSRDDLRAFVGRALRTGQHDPRRRGRCRSRRPRAPGRSPVRSPVARARRTDPARALRGRRVPPGKTARTGASRAGLRGARLSRPRDLHRAGLMPMRLGGGHVPRACSRKFARNAASAIPFSPRPGPIPMPG